MLDDPSTFWLDVSRKGKDVRGIKVKFSAFILGLLIVKSVSFTFKKNLCCTQVNIKVNYSCMSTPQTPEDGDILQADLL